MLNENSLLIHVRPYVRRLMLAIFFMIIVAFFTGILALIIRPIIDELLIQSSASNSMHELSQKPDIIKDFFVEFFNIKKGAMTTVLPIMLFFIFLGQSVFTFLSLYLMKTLGLKVVRNIRNLVYKNLINQSVDYLNKAKTGDLVSRISNDIEKIKFAVSETLSVYVREIFSFVILLIIIFYQDWFMALISFIIAPVAAVLLVVFGKKVKKRGIQSQEVIGGISNFLSETVTGNKVVKAYNMEDHEIKRFSELNENHYRINSKIAFVFSVTSPIMNIIGGIVSSLIFLIGMKRVAAGLITPGQFMSFLTALFLLYNPLKRLSQANNDYQQGISGYKRILEILKSKNPIKDKPDAINMKKVFGSVEFQNVNFSYIDSIPVIKSMNFKADPGDMIALVGASGSGKTTIINLLLRFYDKKSGKILIDGEEIKDISIKSLRDSISLVTQDVFLFNDTIYNNITYGSKNFTDEDLKRVTEIARADKFINELPKKFETIVGERGVFLSNGQRQRISIARAILKKPSILIFDEATSALDTESEKLIQDAMLDIMKGRTSFVIAHRLSTIIEADQILVIEDGEIKEMGSHKELLKKRSIYYSLYNLQFPDMNIIM